MIRTQTIHVTSSWLIFEDYLQCEGQLTVKDADTSGPPAKATFEERLNSLSIVSIENDITKS